MYLTIFYNRNEHALVVLARQIMMKQSIFFKSLKPLLFTLIFAFVGYPNFSHASLSTGSATLSQAKTSAKSADSASNAQKVHNVYRQWAGTRYRLGGTGANGIDCSAFVQKTMSGAFHLNLPRTTADQRFLGKAISKSELRAGDLVFFRNNHHVGVYIGGGKFVHASSSRGVTTSSLSESYWSRNYTQSRRVL